MFDLLLYTARPMPPSRLVVPGLDLISTNDNSGAASVFGSANDAVYVPFVVAEPITVTQIHVVVGTQNGNVDVGIYNAAGTRLVSAGTTAVGAVGVQTFNITDTLLPRGRYFAAMATDSATAKFSTAVLRVNRDQDGNAVMGIKKQATAFPLPATATFASPTSTFVPYMVLELN